jgi:hypothetical protein
MKPATTIPAAVLLAAAAVLHAAEPPTGALPGTAPLAPHPDLSAAMVAGIDTLALERIERSPAGRRPTREKLASALGMVDRRLPVAALEFVGDTATPALVSRGTEFSQGDRLRIRTNVPHREWIRGLLVQGPGCLPVLQRPPNGADSCASRRPRHSSGTCAAVGDLPAKAIALLPR